MGSNVRVVRWRDQRFKSGGRSVKSKRSWVGLALTLLIVMSVSGSALAKVSYKLTKPSIKIINNDSKWQVKVWAYELGGSTTISCQTLGWSTERHREIEPKVINDVYSWAGAWLVLNHCGEYSKLGLWFRVYHTDTGEEKDFDLTDRPTTWGDTWTWNGREWLCSGYCH